MGIRTCVAALVVALVAASASADTGGRMGGGSWDSSSSSSSGGGGAWSSGGSSRSSSSWSSSGGSRSSSWSSPSSRDRDRYGYSSGGGYSSYDSTPSSFPIGLFGLLLGGAFLLLLGYLWVVKPGSPVYTPDFGVYDDGGPLPTAEIDVSVVRIAIDGRARKFVQNELRRIAGSADTATPDGRATMLREVTLLLRRVRDAWVYGGAVNEPMRGMSAAKAVFDRHTDDARARFREETVTSVQGQRATAAPAQDYIPRSEEGPGLILVTIIVAARSELFTVAHIGDGEDLRKALEAASHRSPSELVAIEIVWQPSEDADRLSSLELEAKYPRPDLIPIRGALVGKAFCSYCGGPFPAELVSCPHCGAPAPGSENAVPRAA